MTKPALFPVLFALLFQLSLSPAALRAAEAAPPPPEFAAPDAVAPAAAAPEGGGFDLSPSDGKTEDQVAAPQISDDQMVKNALEISMQLYHAEEYDAVAKSTAQILERYPKKQLYWVRYLQGLALEHQGLYTAAIENYNKVREQAARSTYANAATFRRGLCELKAGLDQEAIYTLREIIDTNPRSEYRLQSFVHLGNLYRRTRDWRAAQRIYKDLIRLYPGTAWAFMATTYLAETYTHMGRRDTAIKVYTRLERDLSVPLTFRSQAKMRIAELHMAEERWQQAIQCYREAIRDYNSVPGVVAMAQDKIVVATEGRRTGRVPYRSSNTPVHGVLDRPADESFQKTQENEAVPYK